MTVTAYVGPPGSRFEIPPHWGQMWIEGEMICLQLPAIVDIHVPGRPPLSIDRHTVRMPADVQGIASAEMVLFLRRDMMKKENEAVLLAFAEVGSDPKAILQLYKKILP